MTVMLHHQRLVNRLRVAATSFILKKAMPVSSESDPA